MSDHPCTDSDGDGTFERTGTGRWILEDAAEAPDGLFVLYCPFCGELLP